MNKYHKEQIKIKCSKEESIMKKKSEAVNCE